MKLVKSDGALIGALTQRCVDRGCEGGEENESQADSSESCFEFYGDGADLVRWCDPCLMSAAINALTALREERDEANLRREAMLMAAQTKLAHLTEEREGLKAKVGLEENLKRIAVKQRNLAQQQLAALTEVHERLIEGVKAYINGILSTRGLNALLSPREGTPTPDRTEG